MARRLATLAAVASVASVRLALVAPPGTAEASKEERIRELAEAGAEVLIFEAAPTDRPALAAGLAQVEEAWGPLTGAFHLSGNGGPAEWMESALVLDSLLGDDRPLDFPRPLFVVRAPGRRAHPSGSLGSQRPGRRPGPGADHPGSDADRGYRLGGWSGIRPARKPSRLWTASGAPSGAADRRGHAGARGGCDRRGAPDGAHCRRGRGRSRGRPAPPAGSPRSGARPWASSGSDRAIASFDLGGDSLIAVQVLARLRDTFPVELPVAVLFERPTIPELRDAVEEALTARLEELPEEEAERLVAMLFD